MIHDETGEEVRRIDLEDRSEGESSFTWDGLGRNGEPLPPGSYTVEIIATHEAEGAVGARASISGVANSVEFTDDGATMFGLGSLLLDPGSILSLTAVSDTDA